MERGFPWLAVVAFAALGGISTVRAVPAVQDDLGARTRSALMAEGLPTDRVRFSGRDAFLEAELAAEPTFDRAREVTARAYGVRVVNRRLPGTAAAASTLPPSFDDAGRELEAEIRALADGRTVEFQSGSADITPAGRVLIDEIIELLRRSDDGRFRVRIEGHTDTSGDREANALLSEQRAEAVRAYMVAAGIDGSSLLAAGYGGTRPIATNASPEGRNANRRIEFRVITEN